MSRVECYTPIVIALGFALAWLSEWSYRRKVQDALRRACREARLANAWKNGTQDKEFHKCISECEKFISHDQCQAAPCDS